jgi:hypothetical protein
MGVDRAAAALGAESDVPHSPQKRSVGPTALPHEGHDCVSGDPQFAQNFFEGGRWAPQFGHTITR